VGDLFGGLAWKSLTALLLIWRLLHAGVCLVGRVIDGTVLLLLLLYWREPNATLSSVVYCCSVAVLRLRQVHLSCAATCVMCWRWCKLMLSRSWRLLLQSWLLLLELLLRGWRVSVEC